MPNGERQLDPAQGPTERPGAWEQLELPFGAYAAYSGQGGAYAVERDALACAEYDAEQLWRAGQRLSRTLRS